MMPFAFLNPTFSIAYHRFEARPVNYDALYNEAFKQIGERTITVALPHNFTPIDHREIFAPIEEMKARIREAGGWDAYWAKQNRAYNNFLHSALGFEPTDHSDAPPYIPTTATSNPQPCIDFGFEPTEASE